MAEDRIKGTPSLPESGKDTGNPRVIFEEGSTGSEMYLIHSGKVLLSVRQNQTKQVPLVVLNPGDFFGEWPS